MTVRWGAITALLTIFILGWPLPSGAQEGRPVGRVEALTGTVRATSPASGDTRALSAGAPLFEGDVVHTGHASRVALRLADGSTLQLGNDTDLELSWVLADTSSGIREMALAIPRGIVRTIVDAIFPRSAVRLETSTAITSVRGTDWIAEAQPETSAVVVLDGQVEVESASVPAAVLLGPGEGTDVAAGAPPTPPATWGDARRESFIQRTTAP